MPTYEDPGCAMKFFCPHCAVYQANGCVCPQVFLVGMGASCYTMLCWDPTQGKPVGAGPAKNDEMER